MSFDSSISSSKAADFVDISASLPAKLSIVYVSFIVRRSNSAIKVCNLPSLTLSAPT